jgi:HSP20 family protein
MNDKQNKPDLYKSGHPFFRDSYFPRLLGGLAEMEKVMGEFFKWPNTTKLEYRPAVSEWKTEKDKYIGTIELPGIKKEEIKIQAIDGGLEIIAKQHEKKKDQNSKSETTRKFQYYSYLPEDSDAEKIEAKYENGVLNINIPRIENKEKKSGLEIKVN